MRLADSILADRGTVLDPDGFAETVEVEGREVAAQLDSDRIGELSGGAPLALATDATVLFARTEDLPRRRKPGDVLMVDGREHRVLSWEDRAGVSEVALERPQ